MVTGGHWPAQHRNITWMCIENFLRVAVRAQWGPEGWYLKCATVLSHHGTMNHFPYWKDWTGYDCRLEVSFKPVGEAEWSSSKSLKQETKAVFYILWRKIKSMNKEERMGTSAKHSSCMALKTLPRKADYREDLISYCWNDTRVTGVAS